MSTTEATDCPVAISEQGLMKALVSFLASTFFIVVVVYAMTTFAFTPPHEPATAPETTTASGWDLRPEHGVVVITTNLLTAE